MKQSLHSIPSLRGANVGVSTLSTAIVPTIVIAMSEQERAKKQSRPLPGMRENKIDRHAAPKTALLAMTEEDNFHE